MLWKRNWKLASRGLNSLQYNAWCKSACALLSLPGKQLQRCLQSLWHLKITRCNFWLVYSNVETADILFPAQSMLCSHCGIDPMSVSVIDTLSQMLLCDLSCQRPFFFQAVHWPGSARGLERCPPFNCQASQPALNPFVFSMSWACYLLPPLVHKTALICPLNIFHLLYCPFWQTTNKQTVDWNIPHTVPACFHSFLLHSHACNILIYMRRTHQSCLDLL